MHNDIPNHKPLAAGLLMLLLAPLAQAQFGGPVPVQVANVQATRLTPTVDLPGTIFSRDDAQLSAEVEGRLAFIAEVGTRVAQGDTLANIINDVLSEQQAEFSALVEREISQIGFLENEVERLRKLARNNNAALSQLERTESELSVARNNLRVARSRLQQTRVRIDALKIVAPFAGVVIERLKNPGERIGVNEAILRLVNPARLEVVARAPLAAVAQLTEGVEIDIRGGRGAGTATVRTVVPFGDARTHMYELRATVNNADAWLVGENVRAAVPTASAEQVLAVPRDALVLRREGTAVFRVNAEDIAQRIPVTVGIAQGDLVAVSGDLTAGDRVIIRGAELLRDGTPVGVQASSASSASGGKAAQ